MVILPFPTEEDDEIHLLRNNNIIGMLTPHKNKKNCTETQPKGQIVMSNRLEIS